MAEQHIPAKTIRTCDRCRVEMTPENTKENRGWMTKATQHRFIRKGMVSRLFDSRPKPLIAEIHFCDGCWWEFDRLFCQGQGLNLAPGIKAQRMISGEHGRAPVTPTENGENTHE